MVFSSLTFLFFLLPICLLGYAVVGRRLRNLWLLIVSVLFYVWGSGALVILLAVSTLIDYAMGWLVAHGRATENRSIQRLGVTFSVITNLGLLGYFKYANFFVDQIDSIGLGGFEWETVTLPVGISFYTFQSMSYTIDISRGRAEHLRNPLDFALYVTLFPQLVAGPIVRFHEISEQIRDRFVSLDLFTDGCIRFAHGLAKKVIVADSVAPIADAAFAGDDLSITAAWIGLVAYSIQIYFDFSGYSDMAIGLGMMFGFRFPENFARPYSAVSVTDFWRRWHITLSNWFRDYVYIPLGGNRLSSARTIVNLSLVFFLTGLWHGANWTFIVWGLFHGALLVTERATGQRVLDADGAGSIVRRGYVLLAVMIGWVFFRAADVGAAVDYLAAMFSTGGIMPDEMSATITHRSVFMLVFGAASVALPRSFVTGPKLVDSRGVVADTARSLLVLGVFPYTLVLVASGTFSPFLYFQF